MDVNNLIFVCLDPALVPVQNSQHVKMMKYFATRVLLILKQDAMNQAPACPIWQQTHAVMFAPLSVDPITLHVLVRLTRSQDVQLLALACPTLETALESAQ